MFQATFTTTDYAAAKRLARWFDKTIGTECERDTSDGLTVLTFFELTMQEAKLLYSKAKQLGIDGI